MAVHLVKFAANVDGIIEDLWPRLQAVLHLVAATSFVKWNKPIIITSLWREPLHDADLHALNRAVDIDVDDQCKYEGITPDEAQYLADFVNRYVKYDESRPYLKTCLYGHDDPNDRHWNHIHVQVHKNTKITDFFA